MARRKEIQLYLVAVAALLIPLWSMVFKPGPLVLVNDWLLVAISLVCVALSACMFDMARRRPADSHTWTTLLYDYYQLVVEIHLHGPVLLKQYQNMLSDCRLHQESTLRAIVETNRDTVYGRDHGISDIRCGEDLVSSQPLTDYEHYRAYIDRVVEGEDNAMVRVKVVFLGLTSGTTGRNKVYPVTPPIYEKYIEADKYTAACHREFHIAHGLARRFDFRLYFPPNVSPTGVPMGGVGSLQLVIHPSSITPICFMQLKMENAVFYSQALFALAERELGFISGFSSDVFLAFWEFLVANKERLCDDIGTGIISPCGDLEGSLLQELNSHLTRDPDRAEELRQAFRGSSVGLARRLWPGLSAVTCAKTGSFADAAKILMDSYLKDISMGFFVHDGTEGMYGVQLEQDWASDVYTLVPNGAFLEFIDTDHIHDEKPKTLFMDQLKVGRSYEIVVTSFTGLYRYRVGDVITIAGIRGNTPQYTFSHRMGQVVNVVFERTPESIILAAVSDVRSRLGDGIIVDYYTVTESFHMSKITGIKYSTPCYVFFVEVQKDGQIVALNDEHKSLFDDALTRLNEAYEGFRRRDGIAPAEVIQVARGSFHELRHLLTATLSFKLPRVLRKPEGLQLLWDRRVIP